MLRICKRVPDNWQRGDCMNCPFGDISDDCSIVCYAHEDPCNCQVELFTSYKAGKYKKVPLNKEDK